MYLEQRIEALEGQVDRLIKLVEEQISVNPKSKASATKEPAGAPTTKAPTADTHTAKSLQDRCLALVRKEPANKDKIKDAMSAFGIKLLKDLTDEQLVEMEEVIANLENT